MKLKVLFIFYQIICNIPFVLEIIYPVPFKTLVDGLSFLNGSFLGNLGLNCDFHFDFVVELVVVTVVPILFSLLLFLSFLLQDWVSHCTVHICIYLC